MLVIRINHQRQQGVALVTVILIVALMTTIVSRLSLMNSIWLRQVDNSAALVQAGQATRAAQTWISDILKNDDNTFDAQTDDWAQPVIPVPIAWGEMFGWIEDMQSRFNVNNLINENGNIAPIEVVRFRYLLVNLELDPAIADAVVDWIDTDGIVTGSDGAEDLYYMGMERPYLAANRPIIDEREMLQIKGIDQTAWNRLEPYICALPERTKVNINTAKPEVVAAVFYNPDTKQEFIQQARSLSEQVMTEPFASAGELNAALSETPGLNIDSLVINSGYFRAHTQMMFGNVEQRMTTLYQRNSGGVRIIDHSRTLF
jgi:general secretion pathway protein K